MENSVEEKLSAAIDTMNETQTGDGQVRTGESELDALVEIAEHIKKLPNLEFPGQDFVQQVAGRIRTGQSKKRLMIRPWLTPAAVIAAGLLVMVLLFSPLSLFSNKDVVLAAVQKIEGLKDYYGTLEMRSGVKDNQGWLVRRAEIWNQGEKYAVKDQDGTLTVNNGQKKWQVQPRDKTINLLPLLPDPLQGRFDIRAEADQAMKYPHKAVGEEVVSGRKATKVEVAPPGGLPYYLWIDSETQLPIQLQTAVINSLQTVYTLTNLEINRGIPGEIFNYQPDPQFKIVEKDPGKLVGTLEEAIAIAGFTPVVPKDSPKRILAAKNKLVFDYTDTVISQSTVSKPLEPAPNSALGKAGTEVVEILDNSLRWQSKGIEISVAGQRRVELAKQLAADISLPDASQDIISAAKVKVRVDMEVIKNSQQQVDGGHSPWMLDPAQVAQAYINFELKAKPEVAFEGIKVEINTGSEAVLSVKSGPAKKIYLKRILRQDPSGIWAIVGYDPS